MEQQYKFKAWQPYEGYQVIAISDDFDAIMWGLEHQVDIFTQDGKLVYSPNDDEEYNLKRLEKYGVQCIDDENGRNWERIQIAKNIEELSTEKQNELQKLLDEYSMILQEINLFIEVNELDSDEVWDRANQQYDEDMSHAPNED